MNIVSDKGTHYYIIAKDWRGVERRRRINRFLCVGGPLNGLYRSGDEIREADLWRVYCAFNNAGSSAHSMIFVHDEIIHEEP